MTVFLLGWTRTLSHQLFHRCLFGLILWVSFFLDAFALAMASSANSANPVSPSTSFATDGNKSRFVFGSDDALFGSIETRQQGRPFGRVLDAGTGLHSLRWLATLRGDPHGLTECVAVTADTSMEANCQREIEALGVTDCFSIIRGNWFPDPADPAPTDLPALLGEEGMFDTILADYLIGAMDGFSPYMQDVMLIKLRKFLKPGGRLYLVGLEPLPDSVPGNAAATILCQIRQVRDACILLAGHRCYREYPLQWIERQIGLDKDTSDSDGLNGRLHLVHSTKFPILYSYTTAVKQINVGRSKLAIIRRTNPSLADGLATELQRLDDQLKRACAERIHGKIELGFDYVVTAELE